MPCRSRRPSEGLGRRRLLLALAALPAILAGCGRGSGRAPVGEPLPDIELADLDGRRYRLLDSSGSPLLINVWATWCPPCRAEMASLERLYRALAPHGLRMLGITVDEDLNLTREYLLHARISFPVRSDPGGNRMADLLQTRAIPATLLVGRDGRIGRVVIGERVWDEGEARAWVDALLA